MRCFLFYSLALFPIITESSQHPWFLDSRSSLGSPKRSWYIWKKPRRDNNGNPLPPNNWAQILGEANSAWTYDSKTDEYYLSLFTPEQPDLNWENPEVRAAVHDIMQFWIKRGACGYRMDVINMISKDQNFLDAEPVLGPELQYHPGGKYYVNGPRMHEYLQEIKREVLSKHDVITVGEMPAIDDIDEVLQTVGSKNGELNMIFIFDLVDIDNELGKTRFELRPWTVKMLGQSITKWQKVMIEHDGWNTVFCENHDNPRSVSHFANDSETHRYYGAKLLALMQTTLSGTLFVYQGEELGMKNMPEEWDIEAHYKDIVSINFWKKIKSLYSHDPTRLAQERKNLVIKARDHARTPMQWDDSPNAGFCDPGVEPWMSVVDDYKTVNVKSQMAFQSENDLSVWQFWQRGLQNRKKHADAFVYGDFEAVESNSESIFSYIKTSKSTEKWLIVLNFSGETVKWKVPDDLLVTSWVAGNFGKAEIDKAVEGTIELRPWEGLLGQCER